LAFGFWLLAFGFWLLAFGFWLLAFGFWLLAFGFWLGNGRARFTIGQHISKKVLISALERQRQRVDLLSSRMCL
jgi:hypothetical protein